MIRTDSEQLIVAATLSTSARLAGWRTRDVVGRAVLLAERVPATTRTKHEWVIAVKRATSNERDKSARRMKQSGLEGTIRK
jgi:hypothetical protein